MDEFLKFFNENKDAFLAFGVLLTFIISMLNFVQTRTIERKSTYNSYVTNSRAEWLNKTREITATYISLLESINLYNDYYTVGELKKIQFNQIINKVYEISATLTLSFNYSDDYDRALIQNTSMINECYSRLLKITRKEIITQKDDDFFIPSNVLYILIKEFDDYKKEYILLIQAYFKTEWDRIKDEAEGKKTKTAVIQFKRLLYLNSDNKEYINSFKNCFMNSLKNNLKFIKLNTLHFIYIHSVMLSMAFILLNLFILLYLIIMFCFLGLELGIWWIIILLLFFQFIKII